MTGCLDVEAAHLHDESGSDMPMPRFSQPRHVVYTLPMEPPMFFRGMTARVFPLRGSLLAMQRFADAYVNIVPRELGWFRAITPYVFLMMVDYGSLAPDKTNLGWLSQREIMFTFPVEQYRYCRGQYVFQDWAWLTPYIFVDSGISMTFGREVYGWPKGLVQMGPTAPEWLERPGRPLRSARVDAAVFPELYAGKKQEMRTFLEIERRAPLNAFDLPLRSENPLFPWAVWANLFKDANRLSADALALLGSMGFLRPVRGQTPANRQRMMSSAARSLMPDARAFSFRTVNLKQFRAAEDPSRYCYQSLTDASMRVKRVNRFGLSGDLGILAGDSSGGLGITLHRWASLPIIETLGLETAREWRGEGVDMAHLQPVMPFWYDVDMLYERGVNLAWRTFDTRWRDQEGKEYEPLAEDGALAGQYNGTLAASAPTVAGPFVYEDAAVRVLPLLAEKEKLATFIDSFFNEALVGSGFEFELWSSEAPCSIRDSNSATLAYVYLTVTSFGSMISETNNIGSWAHTEVRISVPVRWRNTGTGAWGVGLVPAFSFVDSATAAISAGEITGIPATMARLELPDVDWMTASAASPRAPRSLMRVDTSVVPAFGQGTEVVTRTILEISKDARPARAGAADWRAVADGWGYTLLRETSRKRDQLQAAEREIRGRGGDAADGMTMALAALAGELPIRHFTLKQYRDVKETNRACYQSLVGSARWIENLSSLCEIEAPLALSIHEYPSQPIIELLGLVIKASRREEGGGIAHEVEPVRPFCLRADIREDLGQRLAFRAGTERWSLAPPAQVDQARSPGQGWPSLSPTLQAIIDGGAPGRLRGLLREWSTDPAPLAAPVTPERARAASRLIEPQMMLDVLLSREWEHRGQDARWFRQRRQLQSQLDQVQTRHGGARLVEARHELFRKLIDGVARRSFGDPRVPVAESRLALLGRTSKGRRAMEEAHDDLVKAVRAAPEPPQARVHEPLVSLAVDRMKVALDDICGEIEIEDWKEYFAPDRRRLDSLAAASARILPDSRRMPGFVEGLLSHFGDITTARFPGSDRAHEDPTPLSPLFAMVRDEEKAQIDALLDWLSKEAQKPDFCLPRDSVGPEKIRLFPRASSWDDRWYSPPRDTRPRRPEHR